VDHVVPRAKSGSHRLNNLAFACPVCNNRKRAHTLASDPETGRRVPLFNPRRQEWGAHFRWAENSVTLTGLTAVGRATIHQLEINRPTMVLFRRLLAEHGLMSAD
jgi:hypothetical protein